MSERDDDGVGKTDAIADAGMSDLVSLHFQTADVRMVFHAGQPWWALSDVAPAVGLSNPSKLAGRLEDYQIADIPIRDISSSQLRRMLFVNEPGIYQLLSGSKKPEAKAFMRWLFTEVLPSIRKYGFYDPPRLAALREEARVPPRRIPAVQSERLLEEFRRYEEREDGRYNAMDIPGVTKAKLKALELGASTRSMLSRGDLWFYLVSCGFDLFYIFHGERRASPGDARALAAIQQEMRTISRDDDQLQIGPV